MSAVILFTCFIILAVSWLRNIFYGYFAVVNVLSFMMVAFDKLKSLNQWYRIRENDLFLLFLFGGWIGGIMAMVILRHKTRKESFLAMTACSSVMSIFISLKAGGFI